MEKKCDAPGCETVFDPKRTWQRFCGKPCRIKFFAAERKQALETYRDKELDKLVAARE